MSAKEKDKKLDDFCSITGISDRGLAESILAACDGNLEMAVNMHIEGGIEQPQQQQQQQPATTASNKSSQNGNRKRKLQPDDDDDDDEEDDEDEVRAPIPQKQETLIEPGYEGYVLRPSTSRSSQRDSRIRTVFDGFRNFSVESEPTSSSSTGGGRGGRKKRSLEELFKPPLDLMHKGDLQSARDSAEKAQKWLMVNIQDPREFQCQTLNRDIWSAEKVKTAVRANFVFWQQYKESELAQRYMTFYPIHEQWPHVAVLDPRTGEQLIVWNSVGDAKSFCQLVAEFLTIHPNFGADQKKSTTAKSNADDEEPTILDANEDDQLAAAIQASLAESSKANNKKRKSSAAEIVFVDSDDEEEAFEVSDDELDDDDQGSSPAKKRSKAVENSPPAKKSSKNEESELNWESFLGPSDDDPASIMIRFPDGARENKKIPDSSLLKALVLYVQSKGFPLETHEIVTNFPRRILTQEDQNKSLKELQITRETIFVQLK